MLSPSDIAKYFLIRAEEDGSLISPLKMQKLVYFAYVSYLLKNKGRDRLFEEKIEAWPAGPVVPSLYRELKKYGSMPIDAKSYVDITKEKLLEKCSKEVSELLDRVYEACEQFTAFQLMLISHRERAWISAREGLVPNVSSNKPLLDREILAQHLKKNG